MPLPSRRRGFALLAVLWAVVGISVLSLALGLVARETVGAAQNRVDETRARWRAEGCAEAARAAIDASLEARGDASWRDLDRALSAEYATTLPECDVVLRAAGSRLDLNDATAQELRLLFRADGVTPVAADSLADAILDWRDPDTLPRASGAERHWYLQARQLVPPDAPFVSGAEVTLVRGATRVARLDTLLDVQDARVYIARAPAAVLRALPGFTDQAVDAVLELRARGALPVDMGAIGSVVAEPARAILIGHLADLSAAATLSPDAWILTTRATQGPRRVAALVELRLVRAGSRAAVTVRRGT